jgi:thioredoxin 1
MDGELTKLTASTFTASTEERSPVVVDFWFEGCGPCKALVPVLEQLANEYAHRLRITTLNVNDAPELAARYDIKTVPTLIVFAAGEPKKRIVNPGSKAQLIEEFREFVG